MVKWVKGFGILRGEPHFKKGIVKYLYFLTLFNITLSFSLFAQSVRRIVDPLEHIAGFLGVAAVMAFVVLLGFF